MNKLFILFISLLFLSACDHVEKLDKQMYEAGEDSLPVTSLQQLEEIDKQEESTERHNVSKLLMKASGTEPGWFAEFYNNRLRLVVDYGKDSLLLLATEFENVGDEKGFEYINASIENGKKNKLIIVIEKKECIDASGEKRSRKVSVHFNSKTYKGCGELVDQ